MENSPSGQRVVRLRTRHDWSEQLASAPAHSAVLQRLHLLVLLLVAGLAFAEKGSSNNRAGLDFPSSSGHHFSQVADHQRRKLPKIGFSPFLGLRRGD